MGKRAFLQGVAFWGVVLGLCYLGLRYALPCFLPLVLGAVMAAALHPAAAGLCQRTGWRYRPCAVLVAVAALTALGLLLWGIGGLVVRQGSALLPQLPAFYRQTLLPLGRGGSDTTAVALAAAFDACGCRVCTDVDGVYDRDPREFPESRRYDSIPYEEMLAMAEGGAKVLHPRSVFLARKYRVPLTVLRTGAETPCTVVGQAERQHHSLAADTVFLFR